MPSGWGLDMNRNRLAITAAVIGAIAYPAWTGSSWHEYCYSFIGVLIDALFGAAAAIGPLPFHDGGTPPPAKETTADGYTYRPVKGADMDGDERHHDRPPFFCLHGPQLRCWAGLGPARHGGIAPGPSRPA